MAMTQAERDAEDARNLRRKLDSYLPEFRWKVETGGIEINGILIQTDAISRANLLGAKELGVGIKWKTPSGFVDLTAAQVSAIAAAVGIHIQKCYAAEAALSGQTFESIEELESAFNQAMEA